MVEWCSTYDSEKATPGGFKRIGSPNVSLTVLLNAVTNVQAKHMRRKHRLSNYLSKLHKLPEFSREDAGVDSLFDATYDHEGGATCR
jgi:hypothetical protein